MREDHLHDNGDVEARRAGSKIYVSQYGDEMNRVKKQWQWWEGR